MARRYGLVPTQLFTWRRELRAVVPPPPSEPMFAPVVVEPPRREPELPRRKVRRTRHDGIELEIDGSTVWVVGGGRPRRWRLSSAPSRRGGGLTFSYIYDFGDNWSRTVQIESVEPAQPHAPDPHFLEGSRRCPPEGVGGTPGFEGFLEAVTTQRHLERRTMLDWYGDPFDPKDINRQMIEYRFA